MKLRHLRWILAVMLTSILLLDGGVSFASGNNSSNSQVSSSQVSSSQVSSSHSKTWRIGYVETSPYRNYTGTLDGIAKGLARDHWIPSVQGLPYTPGQTDSQVMWDWLSAHTKGSRVQFVKDAYYTFNNVTDPATVNQKILQRLQQRHDLNLIIVMGTYAGKQIAQDNLPIPALDFSSSNAYAAGIVKGVNYSGSNHMWAQMDPNRYKRQLQVFYDMFHFKRLGILYENTPVGRIYAALSDVKAVAKEDGFQVVAYTVQPPKNSSDEKRYEADVLKGNEYLATHADAMYLTTGDWTSNQLSTLLQPFYNHKIPVFGQEGASDVQHGALLSIYRASFDGVGQFGEDAIMSTLQGTPLSKLPQIYVDTPDIVINLAVANKIGYQVPFNVLLSADKIFLSIDSKS